MPFTFDEAIQYIQTVPNLTTEELIYLVKNTSVEVDENSVKLGYSGSYEIDGRVVYASETAFAICDSAGSRVGLDGRVYQAAVTVHDTDAYKLQESQKFLDALRDSIPGTNTEKNIKMAEILDGVIGGKHVNFDSAIDTISHNFFYTGSQPIRLIIGKLDATPGSTPMWVSSEIDGIVHGSSPDIDNVSGSRLHDIYETLRIEKGDAAAKIHIQTIMEINSYNNMADNLSIAIKADNTVDIATKADFFNVPGFIDSPMPEGGAVFTKVKDALHNINKARLDNLKELAEFAKDHPQLMDNLKHIGFASVAVSTVMLITDVNDALAAGDEAHASQLVEDYFAGMAGEFVGGVIGLEGALFLTRLVLASTPQGLALAAIAFVGSYIGGNYGEEAGKFLYHLFEELTEKFESISQMLLDAAKEFAKCYISPIVFDLDGDGIELTHVDNGVNFDLDNNGIAEQTGWLGKDDGFLVKDLNNNGKIDNQSEMFGTDNTSTALQKLIALDTNGNGKVEGTELSALRIWKDINQDGVTQAGELLTLAKNQNHTPHTAKNDNFIVQFPLFYVA